MIAARPAWILLVCVFQATLAWSESTDTNDLLRRVSPLAHGCAMGHAAKCEEHEALKALLVANGHDTDAPLAGLEQACRNKEPASCIALAASIHRVDPQRGAALFAAACRTGDAVGCLNEGLNWQYARGVELDMYRARTAYEEACRLGNALGCVNLGFFHERGISGPRDPALAARYWAAACQGLESGASDPLGCKNLAALYATGVGVGADPRRAAELRRKVCADAPRLAQHCFGQDECDGAGYFSACSTLGSQYQNGVGVGKDVDLARSFFETACTGGVADGCYNRAVVAGSASDSLRFFGKACELGDGIGCREAGRLSFRAGDFAAAAQLSETACRLGDPGGCNNAAAQLARGEGVARDLAQARRLYRSACESNLPVACHNLALNMLDGTGARSAEDEAEIVRFLSLACDGSVGPACFVLATLPGTTSGSASAMRYLSRGCELGDSASCKTLAGQAAGKDDRVTAIKTDEPEYRISCDSGAGPGCYHTSDPQVLATLDSARPALECLSTLDSARCLAWTEVLRTGTTDVGRDEAVAIQLLEGLCSAKVAKACTNLGFLYEHGQGVGINPVRAAEIYDQACLANDGLACYNLAHLHQNGLLAEDRIAASFEATRLMARSCTLGFARACSE